VWFFAHHSQVDTSHKGKGKKKKKKTLHPAVAETHVLMQQLHPKEERKEKGGEGRRKKLRPTVQSQPTADLDLVGHRDPRLGLANVFLWFFLSVGLVFSWFL
jgi:hypothetical protein